MGKTYRRDGRGYDEKQSGKKGKHHTHSNGKKYGGMRVINSPYGDDDFFDDDVEIQDDIVINITRDEDS